MKVNSNKKELTASQRLGEERTMFPKKNILSSAGFLSNSCNIKMSSTHWSGPLLFNL